MWSPIKICVADICRRVWTESYTATLTMLTPLIIVLRATPAIRTTPIYSRPTTLNFQQTHQQRQVRISSTCPVGTTRPTKLFTIHAKLPSLSISLALFLLLWQKAKNPRCGFYSRQETDGQQVSGLRNVFLLRSECRLYRIGREVSEKVEKQCATVL